MLVVVFILTASMKGVRAILASLAIVPILHLLSSFLESLHSRRGLTCEAYLYGGRRKTEERCLGSTVRGANSKQRLTGTQEGGGQALRSVYHNNLLRGYCNYDPPPGANHQITCWRQRRRYRRRTAGQRRVAFGRCAHLVAKD